MPWSWRRLALSILFCGAAISALAAENGASIEESAQQKWARRFQSERIQFLGAADTSDPTAWPGAYPSFLRWIYNHLLSHEVSGARTEAPAGCDPEILFARLREDARASVQSKVLRAHYEKCRDFVDSGSNSSIRNALGVLTYALDVKGHPFMSRVRLNFPGGSKLRGLLALHGDDRPRPLVVLRLGIFSNVEEFLAERYLFFQLFEQSWFNLLVLDNTTGAAFLAENEGFTLGGAVEGSQNYVLAKWLRDPSEPLSKMVSSLHFVGVSLGGNGVLAAAMLNEKSVTTEAGKQSMPPIDGFVALCPVVNLKANFDKATEPSAQAGVFDIWSSIRLAAVASRAPDWKLGSWTSWLRGRPYALPAALRYANGDLARWKPLLDAAPWPAALRGGDLWKMTDFWGEFTGIKKPVHVFATERDSLVPPDLNALDLVRRGIPEKNNLAVTVLPRGFHCTLPVAYDWPTVTSTMQGLLIAQAENAGGSHRDILRLQTLDVEAPAGIDPKEIEKILDFEWPKEGEYLILKAGDWRFHVDPSLFEFHFRAATLGPDEKGMLVRWLRQNLRAEIVSSSQGPLMRLQWETLK